MAIIEVIDQVSVIEATDEVIVIQIGADGTLNAGAGLTGGGLLSQSVTIALNAASIASLALADSAVQPGDGISTLVDDVGLTTNMELAAALASLTAVYQPLHPTLTSFGNQSGSGVVVLIGTDTVAVRDITGQASQISITNGNGQSGNINVALAAEVLASLALANTALQPGSNISQLTNNVGYLVASDIPDFTEFLTQFTDVAQGVVPPSGGGAINFLRADGVWTTPAGTSAANPTGLSGLTATNGVANTYMRSDGAPAISQAIIPTWTGEHSFATSPNISGVTPQLSLRESDVGTDLKNWLIRANGGGFSIGTATDAAPLTLVTAAFAVARTLTAVTSVSFGNATDNPTYAFLGNGAISGIGSGLTALNAAALASGVAPAARLGTGTPSTATFLRGDSSWSNTLTGTLVLSNTNDLLRLSGTSPFISWYNAANTIRWTYLQHDGTDLFINNEMNGSIRFYSNSIVSLHLAATGDLRSRSMIRAVGDHTTRVTDELGPGAEIGMSGGFAIFQGYNRNGATYTNVLISGAETQVNVAGTERLRIDTNGPRTNAAFQATGWVSAHHAAPAMAIGYTGGTAYLHAYNGATALFVPIIIRGLSGSIDAGSLTAFSWHAGGFTRLRTDVWHGDAVGGQRVYYASNSLTYFKSGYAPANSSVIFYFRDSGDTDRASITGVGEINANAGFRWLQDTNFYIYNTSGYTYGSWRIGGVRNGYTGLILDAGGQWTFMTNGSTCGVFTQTGGYWTWMEDGTNFTIAHTCLAPAFQISSSRAIKHELRMPSPDEAKAIIKKLRTVVYRLKDRNAPQYDQLGYIAEEVHELCPWLSPDGKAVMYDRVGLLAVLAMQDE
jgi:hypothetical protein